MLTGLESEALQRAFERHYVRLVRFCVLLSASQHLGEDLAQEAFVRAARKVPLIPDPDQQKYLRVTALNAWRNGLRRRRLERQHVYRADQEIPVTLAVEVHDALWRAIVGLPPRQRAVVVLRYYEDLSERETARVLGCSVGTVKSQASKAIRKLKEALHE